MARKIKYTRKDLKSPDEFISTLGRATLWLKDNRTPVLAALAAVIFAAGGILGTRAYFRWQEAKASRDLWPRMSRAQEIFLSPATADREKLDDLEKFLAAHVNAHPKTGVGGLRAVLPRKHRFSPREVRPERRAVPCGHRQR